MNHFRFAILLVFCISLTNCAHESIESVDNNVDNIYSVKRSYIDQYESNGISDPPIELLEAIKDDLGSKEWFRSSYSDIYDRFGSIRWNYAYFSVSDEHRYVVSLPYVNSDHKILGIMIAQGHDDHYDYSFRSRNELFDVAINEEYQYEDAITNIAILTLNSLEISRNHVVIEQYNSFARNFGEYAQSVSTPRTTEITWTTYGSEMYEGWAAAVITEHKAILPCGGSGGGGDLFSDGDNGDITTGGTTTNDNNNEEDREVIIAEIENILANIEECDKLTMTAEAKELIAAQASMLDPCQPDKTAMELLEELLAEICKNKEGINTDGGAITDFDNIDVGDGIIDEEDVMEAIDDLNELSTQFNDYLSGITNTNDCTDQYIEDLYNILENSDCDLSNFASSYSDYFGITESTEQQTVPSVNIGDILCPNIFSVTSVQDGLHVSAGISGLNFQVVNMDGITISISHPYLQIMMAQNLGVCSDIPYSTIMADAVNAAISNIRVLMRDYASYEDLNNSLDFGDNSVVDDAFQKILGQLIDQFYWDCGVAPSGGPLLSNNTQWGDKCFTIYNQLLQGNINGC